jgi:hypothetical protein
VAPHHAELTFDRIRQSLDAQRGMTPVGARKSYIANELGFIDDLGALLH